MSASSSMDMQNEDAVWEAIWKIEGLGRLKHFLWRLVHNSLALCSNLNRRGVKADDHCFLCGRAGEDGGPLLLRCRHVKEVWRAAGLDEVRLRLSACYDMMQKRWRGIFCSSEEKHN